MKRLIAALLLLALDGAAIKAVAASNLIADCALTAHFSLDRATRKPAPADCVKSGPDTSGPLTAQVTNGTAAPDERTTAAIFYEGVDGKRRICTGVLVDPTHILTAGHCACGRVGSYRVTFNQEAMRANTIRDEIKIVHAPIMFDPSACVLGIRPGSDLALIKLPEPMFNIEEGQYGYPGFALASDLSDKLIPGKRLKVVGFGETEKGGVAVRLKAEIPVLTFDCLAHPYNFYCAPFVEMILADRRGGRASQDTCGGDSGGPVFVELEVELPRCPREEVALTIKQTEQVLIGITSRAAPFTHPFSAQHCGGGGIYTLIGRRSVHAWLAANLIKQQTCIIDRGRR